MTKTHPFDEPNALNSTTCGEGRGFDSRRLHRKTPGNKDSENACAAICADRPGPTRARGLDPTAWPAVTITRFWRKVQKVDGGCWLWTGARTSRGYGTVGYQRKNHLAHRISAALAGVALDPSLQIDHLCRVKLCVNPAHLEQVTGHVNVLRSMSVTAINARLTHCKHGHPLEGENVVVRRGRRICIECRRAFQRSESHVAAGRKYSQRPDVKARKAEYLREFNRKRRESDPNYRSADAARKRAEYARGKQ